MLPFIHNTATWYAPGELLLCRLADRALILHPPRALPILQPLMIRRGEVDETHPITAFVDAGRWVGHCPFCPSAQVVSREDPFFLCAGDDGCLNLTVDGAYVPVAFPLEDDVVAIEAVLLDRPQMLSRNWLPDETVDQLLEQNVENEVTPADMTLDELIANREIGLEPLP